MTIFGKGATVLESAGRDAATRPTRMAHRKVTPMNKLIVLQIAFVFSLFSCAPGVRDGTEQPDGAVASAVRDAAIRAPVWWVIAESHGARTPFKIELESQLAATQGGAGRTVGGSAPWTAPPGETAWLRNSAYSGQSTAKLHQLVDGQTVDFNGSPLAGDNPVVTTNDGVNHVVIFAGTNDPASDLVQLAANWASALADFESKAPLSVGNRFVISPVLSTSASAEVNLALKRTTIRSAAEARGWVYCDALTGTWALVAGDVLPDKIHLTDFGYQQVARTVFAAVSRRQ